MNESMNENLKINQDPRLIYFIFNSGSSKNFQRKRMADTDGRRTHRAQS